MKVITWNVNKASLSRNVDIVSAFRNVPTKVDQAHGCDQSRRE